MKKGMQAILLKVIEFGRLSNATRPEVRKSPRIIMDWAAKSNANRQRTKLRSLL